MSDSIKIDSGAKRLLINDGPDYIEFNPTDILFAERFYSLMKEFEIKQVEYQKRSDAIAANTEKDANGIPANFKDGLTLINEICDFMRERIDQLFGMGTSQKAFGETRSLDQIEQFFTGVMPHIKQARSEKIKQYTTPESAKRRKHKKVMK